MARKGYKCKTITLPDGTRKYIYGKTKKEVEEKYQQMRLQLNAGVDLNDHTTFGEFAQMWFNTFKKGVVSKTREAQIKQQLNKHVMPVLSAYEMKEISPMMCKRVFTLMTDAGKSSGLEKQVYQTMKNIFSVAAENGVIYKSPMTSTVKPDGYKPQKRKALSDQQLMKLMKDVRGKRVEPFVVIALGTGMRCGEVLGLKWENVDMIRREIHVRAQMPRKGTSIADITPALKTSGAYRTVPFENDVYKILLELWENRNGPCVLHQENGQPLTQSLLTSYWQNTVGYGTGITPHILRHTAITKWFAKGLDVKEAQYLAGHADANTTLNIYADYIAESRYEETRKKIQGTDTLAIMQA